MPRTRRRHHSRSRTRSRSHSYDRDREPKRRKIESCESPQHKRSLSPESNAENEEQVKIVSGKRIKEKDIPKVEIIEVDSSSSSDREDCSENEESPKSPISTHSNQEPKSHCSENEESPKSPISTHSNQEPKSFQTDASCPPTGKDLNTSTADSDTDESEVDANTSQDSAEVPKDCDVTTIIDDEEPKSNKKSVTSKVSDSKITPKKTLSPNQVKKRLESEKRREEQRKEREKKKHEILKVKEEKQKLREEKEQQKLKEKQEKQEHKQKEIEERQKEKELKEEKKKKEREEKEQKRKEKDEQKRKEFEEKNKEKLKQEEKKQKAATVFANFFTKKSENALEDKKIEETVSSSTFMPFEVKSDMRLAPILRKKLTDIQKTNLTRALQKQTGKVYLEELKAGKEVGKSNKTWLPEDPNAEDDDDEVVIIEDVNPGESIEEQCKTNDKMRAKYLKFADSRRPAYFGTWRKKSKFVKPRKPLALDKNHFDYEVDSDEDWEEGEDNGESLRGSDDEDKENESENEYEVDDDFFVAHGHLSDDEMNDEEDAVISPEAHKAKLKLLKKQFEEEMKGKTHKIKPRVIGCIWYNKDHSNVDTTIHEFLKPLSIISNGPVTIKKRSMFTLCTPLRKSSQPGKPLDLELMPDFLKLIHGNTKNRKAVVTEFLNQLNAKNISADVSKASLSKQVKQFAEWIRCPEDGPLPNKFCWIVRSDVKKEYKMLQKITD